MGELVVLATGREAWATVKQAATYFDVDKSTIHRWQRAGMPSEMFAGTRRYRLSECETWLRQKSKAC